MCAIMNGIAYDGIFRAFRRDLPGVRRLLSAFNSAGIARQTTGHLYFHPRLRWCRRGWSDPSTGRNGQRLFESFRTST